MSNDLNRTIHAFCVSMGILAEELEKGGALGRADFANALRAAADVAEKDKPEGGPDRLELKILRHMAGFVSPASSASGWKPVVIEGGSQEPEHS